MTVEELRSELENLDPEAEVRLAQQPSWPFEYSIGQIREVALVDDADLEAFDSFGDLSTEERAELNRRAESARRVVYIGEGRQLAYLPGAASRELGWR
jgi:hypothetical protein